MDKNKIGIFFGITFNNKVIEFVVFDNNTMDCPTLGLKDCTRMWIKPRFVLYNDKFRYEYSSESDTKYQSSPALVANYYINDELFDYLKENGMISYSNDMAYLYNFKDKKGYDSREGYYGVGSPYKRAKKRGPILVKQRRGEFN